MAPGSYQRAPRPSPGAGLLPQARIMTVSPWHCGLPVLVLYLANLCGAQTSDRPFALNRGQFCGQNGDIAHIDDCPMPVATL